MTVSIILSEKNDKSFIGLISSSFTATINRWKYHLYAHVKKRRRGRFKRKKAFPFAAVGGDENTPFAIVTNDRGPPISRTHRTRIIGQTIV